MPQPIRTAIAPWLSVPDSQRAAEFYQRAFGARETHRFDTPDGPIVRLEVDAAQFWVSPEKQASGPLGGDSIRMILIVADPDALFARALAAGATQIVPVGENHGWRLGRLADPFGLHWEIGYERNA